MVRFDWKLPGLSATDSENMIPRSINLFILESTILSTRQRSATAPVTEQWKVVTDPWLALTASGVIDAVAL